MASKDIYTFQGGEILRHGSQVGAYDIDTKEITRLDENLPKQMAKLLGNRLKGAKPKKRQHTQSAMDDLTPAERELIQRLRAREAARDEYASDPPPLMDPRLGDKTPAYVMWFRRTHPDEYNAKYRDRKFNLDYVPSSGDIPKLPMDEPQERWGIGE